MTISYNWLSEYLPVKIAPERLSKILTSIGLEVESMEPYESVKGGLQGLVIGEVTECEKHPGADKLTVTKVDTGQPQKLQIVCGAPNVAVGQKVVVAPAGTTIYPLNKPPLTMKKVSIRNVESQGMICAEDEIGLGESHAGIMVLPGELKPGTAAADYFKPYADMIFEIGLTPNRMDAMSHLGVARDVCAYLSHHDKKELRAKSPFTATFKPDSQKLNIRVTVENTAACQRYAGVSIRSVKVAPSPQWLQERLQSIGLRPINNIVDITNFILHETGQPLHAFDADALQGKAIFVKNLPEGTPFITLDEKARTLSAQDLMICDAAGPVCIAGVFGGRDSGIKESTGTIFLESAWFNPVDIRKSSFRHNLRTDAAARFEKGVDISNTVNVLKRAALLIKEIAGGEIASDVIDVYPSPREKTEVSLKYHYLKRLSGKNYHQDAIRRILEGLGFEMAKEGLDEIRVKVPFSKVDISLPADIVEEILRIDGFDNIDIPSAITITPAVQNDGKTLYREKIAAFLAAAGFNEILTNSITNSEFFTDSALQTTVRMLNSLSADLNVMRPAMLQSGLQALAYNLNRRQYDLRFYEFGKTYSTAAIGKYEEVNHLCLYITGRKTNDSWKTKGSAADIFYLKGLLTTLMRLLGLPVTGFEPEAVEGMDSSLRFMLQGKQVIVAGSVGQKTLDRFNIRQEVFYADIDWDALAEAASREKLQATELPKQLPVFRDLAFVVPKELPFQSIREAVDRMRLEKLKEIELFDIFESDKLGAGKKSMAVSFSFLDEEKTLNEKEIDGMMSRIMESFENELQAEIRK